MGLRKQGTIRAGNTCKIRKISYDFETCYPYDCFDEFGRGRGRGRDGNSVATYELRNPYEDTQTCSSADLRPACQVSDTDRK